MLSMQIKSVVARSVFTISALVLTSSVFADTIIHPTQKSSNSVQPAINENGFLYPAPTLVESDFTETGVLFVYNDHILNYFNGDSEKLVAYVDANMAHNNQAFINSNIGIKRVVSGLVRVESDDIWSADGTYTDRLRSLVNWQKTDAGIARKQQSQYSYLVSLAGYQKSEGETTMLGQAFVGDNVSWISPFNTDADLWIERTLSHELSHNDGFKHASTDYQDGASFIARHDAAGYECGSHGSIMFVSGLRTEPFFADAEISIEKNDRAEDCGIVGEANAAQVYRDMLKTNFANSESTFANIQATRPKTGVVSIHENVTVVMEGDEVVFDIVFEGGNAGDSVSYVVRQGTAGLDDFHSTIGTVVHDGVNNVYTMTTATLTDKVSESIEHFSYELIYPNGVTVDSVNSTIQASIFDKNDEIGYVEFSTDTISVTEGNSAEITINRIGGSEGVITFEIEASVESATQADFDFTNQTVTFNNGETSKTILISTFADSDDEVDESFSVTITQTLHPLYSASASDLKSNVKVTINNPVTATSTASVNTNSPAAASSPASASTTSQASGGSLNIFWAFMLLLVVLRRHQN